VDTGGEDGLSKRARLEQLEPMEIAHQYTVGFHDMMRIFNVLPPNIEPRATLRHTTEQIEMVQQNALDNGDADEANGSVHFDTLKFAEESWPVARASRPVEKSKNSISESRDNLKKARRKT